jgi:hypothetical protein
VLLVKTTGDEEGHAPYTRGSAIIVPANVAVDALQSKGILAHELFHVYSRALGADRAGRPRRSALYAVFGYTPLERPFHPPVSYVPRLITNPDGPATTHGITVKADGVSQRTVPMLFADPPRYDPFRGGEFFEYLQFRLVAIQREDEAWVAQTHPDGTPVLLDPSHTNYLTLVGHNTDELFQPDELAAASFALALGYGGDTPVPDPSLLKKLDAVLTR